jgi:hypothetical protein
MLNILIIHTIRWATSHHAITWNADTNNTAYQYESNDNNQKYQ